eukprot:15132468-Ditylum_brightwellii.AAC.1
MVKAYGLMLKRRKQYDSLIYAWDVKFDDRRRARLVANGIVTIGPPEVDVWSGVVNTKSVCTAMFLAMLNSMKILAADISSAYLIADIKEMMYTKLGSEFGDWTGVGSPEYYLGGDVKITWRFNCRTEFIIQNKLKEYMSHMDPNYHAKIDDADFLTSDDISKYRMMGSLNWLVTMGRYDIHYIFCTLAQHMMMPRQGHLYAIRRVFG